MSAGSRQTKGHPFLASMPVSLLLCNMFALYSIIIHCQLDITEQC